MATDNERTPPVSGFEPLPDEPMVAVFSSMNHDAEMESLAVQTLLDASSIPAVVVGPHILPNLEFQVQVPEHLADEARQIIRDARQSGRRAANEGEAESEAEGVVPPPA